MTLQNRIAIVTSLIVIAMGLLTIAAINVVISTTLTDELINHGATLVRIFGESIANSLLDGDRLVVQEALNSLKATNSEVAYAYAVVGSQRVVVHTFTNGFPLDLIHANPIPTGQLIHTQRLLTETGAVRDIGWQLAESVDIRLHIGLNETGIGRTLQQVTDIVMMLTLGGMLFGTATSFTVGRLITQPLKRLTEGVRRFEPGQLTITNVGNESGEIGELAQAFRQMAVDLKVSITRLRNSEAGYRALIEAAGKVGEGIALIRDEHPGEGTFLFVNDEFCRLTGYARQQLLNLNAAEIIHPHSIETVHSAWQSFRVHQVTALRHEMKLVTREGQKVVVETGGTLTLFEGQRALAWFVLDITDRKAREKQLHRRNRELSTFNSVSAMMNQHDALPVMLQRTLEQIVAALDLNAGWISVLSDNGKSEVVAAVGMALPATELTTHFPDCGCGEIIRSRRPEVVKPHQKCTAWQRFSNTGASIQSHASVSLVAGSRVVGVLSVGADAASYFDDDNFRLLTMVGRHIGTALENVQLWNDLQDKERLRTQLLAKSIRAQEDERRRIARELHDETGQSLNALIFGLKAAELAIASDPAHGRDLVGRLKAAAGDAVRELQTVIYDLRPSVLDDLGLLPALRWYAETRLESQGIDVVWEVVGEERRLLPDIETALFRIAQEAITNIIKYADASVVSVRLSIIDTAVSLRIEDNGRAFDLAEVFANREENGRGLGLLGMNERAELLGGQLKVLSTKELGTHVWAEIPLCRDRSPV